MVTIVVAVAVAIELMTCCFAMKMKNNNDDLVLYFFDQSWMAISAEIPPRCQTWRCVPTARLCDANMTFISINQKTTDMHCVDDNMRRRVIPKALIEYEPRLHYDAPPNANYEWLFSSSMQSNIRQFHYDFADFYERVRRLEIPSEADFESRRPIAWCISDCRRTFYRTKLMEQLISLMPTETIYRLGTCLNDPKMAKPVPGTRFELPQVYSQYKIVLAFENSEGPGLIEDYVSEKLFLAFLGNALPVYIGSTEAKKLAPSPDSFVFASNMHNDAQSLATLLRSLLSNYTLYRQYFTYRTQPLSAERAFFEKIQTDEQRNRFCHVCEYVANDLMTRNRKKT